MDPSGDGPLIVTLGDLILDVIVRPRAPLRRDGDTPAEITLAPGGQAANVAAWVAALGGRARLVCVRGDDPGTEMAERRLAELGVEVVGPRREGHGGRVVSLREDDGRTLASDRGVAADLRAEEVDPAWGEGADVLHISGYCLLAEPMARAAVAAAAHVERVSVDLASAHDIELADPRRIAALVEELAPAVIFATAAEHAVLADHGGGLDRAEWVIKQGPQGAIFPDGGHRPAPAVSVQDATGAGDALAAGYLLGGPDRAMRAAAACLEHVGAMPVTGAKLG